MSRRLLVMLIFVVIRLKSRLMTFSSSLNLVDDCFYEKRIHTSLNGYNELHGRWISELDCLDRCLKFKSHKCRSFEHWHSKRHGLCVHANTSLSDQPWAAGRNLFVDYYEIDCRKDTKAVRLQTISCPGDHLNVVITLNGIDPNYVLLGDTNCKPLWSNDTHAQFVTHVDNCSLTLTDASIVGKLRWEGVDKETNQARQYGRFFFCPSDIQQIRLAHLTSSTTKPLITRTTSSTSAIPHRQSSPIYDDDVRPTSSTYRISLQWTLHNQTFLCPDTCSISLFSFINVSFDDTAVLSSTLFVDSCDLVALHPYSDYVQTRRLISQGCSADPTVIHLSSEMNLLSTFHYSFYLYNILRELIPFEIQCRISQTPPKQALTNRTLCSSSTTIDSSSLSSIEGDKRDQSHTLFLSPPINVTRHVPPNVSDPKSSRTSGSTASTTVVHQIECLLSVFALFHFLRRRTL